MVACLGVRDYGPARYFNLIWRERPRRFQPASAVSHTLVLVPPRGRFIAVHLGVGALD
jgi:hypothetical protein